MPIWQPCQIYILNLYVIIRYERLRNCYESATTCLIFNYSADIHDVLWFITTWVCYANYYLIDIFRQNIWSKNIFLKYFSLKPTIYISSELFVKISEFWCVKFTRSNPFHPPKYQVSDLVSAYKYLKPIKYIQAIFQVSRKICESVGFWLL